MDRLLDRLVDRLVGRLMARRALLLGGLFALLAGCQGGSETLSGQTMGTYFTVQFDSSACSIDQARLERRLVEINKSMSTYDPSSELSVINDAITREHEISDDLQTVLEAVVQLHELSVGAFDPTIGPLVDLWGFGAPEQAGIPTPAQQAAVAGRIGMDHISLRRGTLWKRDSHVRLDLSAIAKGYAVDALSEILRASGCSDYMVDIGGEIYVSGKSPRDTPWRLGIETPDPEQLGRSQAIVRLTDMAIATSGDYRNFRVVDGQKVDHVFDPRKAKPSTSKVVSATVLHPSTMMADGYATTFMVLTEAEGLALANRLELPVYLMVRESPSAIRVVYNAAMKEYLDVNSAP